MAQNVTVQGASYADVPAVVLPKTGGGTASFTDVSDTTAAAGDVASGKYFYTAAGVKTAGTASGGGGGGYFTEGTFTLASDTANVNVNCSFEPKYVYAFVTNWRELGHTSWRKAALAGKISGAYQRFQSSSRFLNGSPSSSGGIVDNAISSYSSGTLTFMSATGGSIIFPAGATVEWFAAGNGGAS